MSARVSCGLAFALGLLALLLVGWLSLRVFQHDDFMYVTTAALWPQHGVYAELPFMQMPLIAWLQGMVAHVVPPVLLYPALLGLSALLVLVGAGVLLRLAQRRGGDAAALLGLWVLLLFNRGTLVALATTSNHALQFALAMLLLALLLSRPPTGRAPLWAGALLGLLMLTKINSLPLVLPVVWWLTPRGWFTQGWKVALAGLVVMLPLVPVLLQAPAEVWALNVTAPALNSEMRGLNGWLDNRLLAVMGEVFLLPVFLAAAALWGLLLYLGKVRWPEPMLLVFLFASTLAALLPGKVYVYHFLLPYAVLCLIFIEGIAQAPVSLKQSVFGLLVLSLLWTMAIGWREANSNQLIYGNKIERLQRVANAYTHALESTPHCATQIYSMAAIPALAGPLPVTPASAVGPFLQRVANIIPSTSPLFRFVDPAALLAGSTAFLSGYHAKEGYEAALVAEAERRHYTALSLGVFPIAYGEGPWMLYLPPCEKGQP